jgi:TRAP-type C4-dicarboxylate transport system substrate-binding protein
VLAACAPKGTPTPGPTTKPLATPKAVASPATPPEKTEKPKPAPEKIVLKVSTCWPVTNPNVDTLRHFIELVNERAKGELEIKLAGGPELISAKEHVGAVGKGVMDMGHDNNITFPIALAADFASSRAVANRTWQDRDFLSAIDKVYREKANAVVLSAAGNIFVFNLGTAKKPVTKLEDVKGLRLRTHGGLSNVITAALGAAPTTIATAEVYTALERGTVDGLMRPLISLLDMKEYEVTHYVVLPYLFMANAMFIINQDVWKKLPEHLKKVLSDAATDNLKWAEPYYDELDMKAIKELEGKGVKFNTLSPEEFARWRKVIEGPVREWYLKEAGTEAAPLLDILKKYEK